MIINGQKTGLVTVFDLESKMMLKRNIKVSTMLERERKIS